MKQILSIFFLIFSVFVFGIDFDEAQKQVSTLVEKFKSNENFYTSAQFREKDTRREFIDPFFAALGWDVTNTQNNPLFLQDMVPETRLRIGEHIKYADYGMRLGARAVFYVEAKAASKDIDSPEYIFQAKRYAWSSMCTDFVVLTDFEDFRVYEAVAPSFDAPHIGAVEIFRMNFKDYPEKFGLIWKTFSKEAVMNGSLEKLLKERNIKERAPADEHFIADFDAQRIKLGTAINENNPGLSEEELNAKTLRVLNHIVFERILEDRDIETTGRLRDCVLQSEKKDEPLSDLLKKEYTRLCKRYNNVLFNDSPLFNTKIPDGLLKEIIMSYYPPQSPYNFSAMQVSVLGKIYENCLGKHLVRKDGKVLLEEKPEVRQAGGVFYTPEWAAAGIVERVLLPQVKDLPPDEIIKKARVIDPACGCGAFVVSAAEYLIKTELDYYARHPELQGEAASYKDDYGRLRLTAKEKARIISKCIWAVDIDAQAVEVTQIWLYILMLENEGSPVVEEERKYKIPNKTKEQPEFKLPDIKKNIICKNTLMDKIDGKYSAVIGNPPYLRLSAMKEFIPEQYKYIREHYSFVANGQPDLYCAFVEKGIELLADNGRLGFLLSNKFLISDYAREMRKAITSQNLLNELIHCGPAKLFQDAKVSVAVLILQKSSNPTFRYSKLLENSGLKNFWEKTSSEEYENSSMFARTLPAPPASDEKWAIPPKSKDSVLNYMQSCKLKFKDIGNAFSGVTTGNDEIFVIDPNHIKIEKNILKSFIYGSDVKRYGIIKCKKYVIWPYKEDGSLFSENEFRENYPLAWEYLNKHREKLETHKERKIWYAYTNPRNKEIAFSRKLILTASSNGLAKIALDESNLMRRGIGCAVILKDAHYSLESLLGILNSSIVFDYISLRSKNLSSNYVYVANSIDNLPIPEYNDRIAPMYKAIESKVKELLKTEDEKKRAELEAEIDALVIDLYRTAAGALEKAA